MPKTDIGLDWPVPPVYSYLRISGGAALGRIVDDKVALMSLLHGVFRLGEVTCEGQRLRKDTRIDAPKNVGAAFVHGCHRQDTGRTSIT